MEKNIPEDYSLMQMGKAAQPGRLRNVIRNAYLYLTVQSTKVETRFLYTHGNQNSFWDTLMLEDSTKQGEDVFEQIKARFSKQSVQPWMPERLNTKSLGRATRRDM